MQRFNLHTGPLGRDDDDPDGYHADYARLAPEIGAARMAGTVYVVPPGQSNCPYHYESDEEWLIVLEGRATVRHPDGEDELGPGDVVCFPAGPAGAHKITNRGEEPMRMLIVSTRNMPAIAVYPDSDKIGVFTEDRRDNVMVRRESDVDYWDRET
ncbi:MAG: hypothetical protein QOF04_67 [Solirubrobacteraceae bacterium]|nr:hypothetical protein [Solirubrobacteraceae bacterium]